MVFVLEIHNLAFKDEKMRARCYSEDKTKVVSEALLSTLTVAIKLNTNY